MAADTITVYPKPGVTVYAPGGVHGFGAAYRDVGVPLPAAHATLLHATGSVETAADRQKAAMEKQAATDLAAAQAEKAKADAMTPASLAPGEAAAQ